jgi:hypothetical protein
MLSDLLVMLVSCWLATLMATFVPGIIVEAGQRAPRRYSLRSLLLLMTLIALALGMKSLVSE